MIFEAIAMQWVEVGISRDWICTDGQMLIVDIADTVMVKCLALHAMDYFGKRCM
jgi:hypothetical protein